MLENLSSRLQLALQRLRGKGRLGERDVDEALREVRLALLEADVNFRVVKDFLARVRERAVGEEVLASLTPAQQVVKIVHEELTALLGGTGSRLTVSPKPPTVILLVGLQGSGKTTTAAKLALHLRRQGRQPLLVAADVYRPAAVEQLRTLGRRLDLPVIGPEVSGAAAETVRAGRLGGETADAVAVAAAGLAEARRLARDTVIIDTAGRLHVDDALMEELAAMRRAVSPHEVLLVVDAMTGQDAVTVATEFQSRVGIDGVVLTKLDGDARGGAALSVRAVTRRPIKFVGLGEKLEALEPFHPDRLASRILGMGDVLGLIEKARESIDRGEAEALERKLRRREELTLEDFLAQIRQMKRLGSLEQVLGLLPGMGRLREQLKGAEVDDRLLVRSEAIVNSMTLEERRRPDIIDGSRRRRIARGSGTTVQDVNKLLRDFDQVRQMFKRLPGVMAKKRKRR